MANCTVVPSAPINDNNKHEPGIGPRARSRRKGGKMTAEMAGKAAIEGIWSTLRRLRDQWLIISFLLGALFWLRDTYAEFAQLPALVRDQMNGLAAVEATVARLEEQVKRRLVGDRSPILAFPGNRHEIADGVPGAWTVLRWRPVRVLRQDCLPGAIDVWMVDSRGRWSAAETALAPMPELAGEADLAFGVRIPEGMAPGRARVLAQISFDCGTHRQVESAPWLHFRVLDG